jgi:hypothetical protein
VLSVSKRTDASGRSRASASPKSSNDYWFLPSSLFVHNSQVNTTLVTIVSITNHLFDDGEVQQLF